MKKKCASGGAVKGVVTKGKAPVVSHAAKPTVVKAAREKSVGSDWQSSQRCTPRGK